MTALAALAQKFNDTLINPVIQKEETISDTMGQLKEMVREVENLISTEEAQVKETRAIFNEIPPEFDREDLNPRLERMKISISVLRASNFKLSNDEEFVAICDIFSHGLSYRIERIIEDFDDLLEDINLSLEAPDELEKIELLAEEYAKIVQVDD